MPESSNVIVLHEGTPIAEVLWDRDLGTGQVRYLRENVRGVTVLLSSETLAKHVLAGFAERGCSFEAMR